MSISYVYIIQSGNSGSAPIKIGMSDNPEKRITELQTGNPYLLSLRVKIPCENRGEALRLESFLHRSFWKHKLEGEWFRGGMVNLKAALNGWEEVSGNKSSKVNAKGSYGNKGPKSEIERLTFENKKLKGENRRLKKDMEEYLDDIPVY